VLSFYLPVANYCGKPGFSIFIMPRNTILYVANTSWYLFNFRLNILKAMRCRGWQVVVAAPRDAYSDRLETMGFQYQELNIDRKGYSLFRDIGLLLRLHRLLRGAKPQIVHFFYY